MYFVSLFILAFAVSLDSFGVGITYGMRKVKIPLRSIMIIALCSAVMIYIATGVAQGFLYFLTPDITEILGGVILLSIGCWAIINLTRHKGSAEYSEEKKIEKDLPTNQIGPTRRQVWHIELKKMGIAIQVLRTPMAADVDRSGKITSMEALILGLALSLDAFGAGIGAALMGYPTYMTALLIGGMSSLFVYFGMRFGSVFANTAWLSKLSYVPGFILIVLGLYKIF